MAVSTDGRVRLADVARVFRRYGTLREIEDCMDELVNEGLATKLETPAGIEYVIEAVARQTAEANEHRLAELQSEAIRARAGLEKASKMTSDEILGLEELRSIWLGGWGDLDVDQTVRLDGYAAMILNREAARVRRDQRSLEQELTNATREIEKLQRWKDASYLTVGTP